MFADVHKKCVIGGKLPENCLGCVLYASFLLSTTALVLHVFVYATGINSGLAGIKWCVSVQPYTHIRIGRVHSTQSVHMKEVRIYYHLETARLAKRYFNGWVLCLCARSHAQFSAVNHVCPRTVETCIPYLYLYYDMHDYHVLILYAFLTGQPANWSNSLEMQRTSTTNAQN